MNDPNNVSKTMQAISAIAANMVDGGLDPVEAQRRADCKAKESKLWLTRAAVAISVAVVLAVAIVAVGLYVVVPVARRDGSFPVLTALIFLGAIGVTSGPLLLVALYCATQSSAEFMERFVKLLPLIRGIFRKGDA